MHKIRTIRKVDKNATYPSSNSQDNILVLLRQFWNICYKYRSHIFLFLQMQGKRFNCGIAPIASKLSKTSKRNEAQTLKLARSNAISMYTMQKFLTIEAALGSVYTFHNSTNGKRISSWCFTLLFTWLNISRTCNHNHQAKNYYITWNA